MCQTRGWLGSRIYALLCMDMNDDERYLPACFERRRARERYVMHKGETEEIGAMSEVVG